MPTEQYLRYIMASTSCIRWDDNADRFVLNQHS